jgi:hypothetical protein
MKRWLRNLGQTYRYRPAQVLGIAGLLAIFGALFAEGWWWRAVLVDIGTALLLIPPIIVTERLIVSEEVEEVREAQVFSESTERAKDGVINAEEAIKLFESGSPKDRLVGLALAQVEQNPEFFPQVIDAIEHPESAFEQAKALEAAEVMLTKLSGAQKQRLVDVVNENPWISEDNRYRWAISRRILKKLGH